MMEFLVLGEIRRRVKRIATLGLVEVRLWPV